MPTEPILREKARDAILSGRLPAAKPSRTVYGHSAGATCAVCGDPVRRAEMEFELEFRTSPWPYGKSLRDTLKRLSVRPEVRRCHLHHRCFVAWKFERTLQAPPKEIDLQARVVANQIPHGGIVGTPTWSPFFPVYLSRAELCFDLAVAYSISRRPVHGTLPRGGAGRRVVAPSFQVFWPRARSKEHRPIDKRHRRDQALFVALLKSRR